MSRRFLVTGGAGFIGSHLVERLIEAGDEVYVVDDLSTGTLSNLKAVRGNPRLHVVVDSIMNWPMMNDVVAKCDQVVHLAAAEGMRKVLEEPVETIATNVRGTEIVLDCCNKHDRPLFLASSSEIYGKSTDDCLDEEHDRLMGSPTQLQWAYAATKVMGEYMALAYQNEKGLRVVIGRYFNTVGPRQTGRWGMVVPNFVSGAIAGEPLMVYGDGQHRRSFLHVADAVDATLGLVDSEQALGRVFNIGFEEEITILDLANRVKERLGSESEVVMVPAEEAYGQSIEVLSRRCPDTSMIREVLGWEPKRSLDDVIEGVAAWMG